MSLKGLKAFDAAAYCASITAAKRAMRDADKRQRRRLVQQQHQQRQMLQQQQQQQQQQQHESDTSPHSDHHTADMGVRPEAGPDSPHSQHMCNRQVAHVHAEAGSVSDLQQQHRHLHSTAQPHGFLHGLLHSGSHSSPGAHEGEQHAASDHDAWWRRALTRMHIHVQEGRRSA
jgi:hypothetical protein